MTGTLQLVGVGPGDPELLTLKAVRVLADADCIAFPKKEGQGSMALDIARAHVPETTRLLPVSIPMEVERGAAQAAYDAAAGEMAALIAEGQTVAYLCEGDPLFYGSAMYLIERLAAHGAIEVVPGITSLTAAAAAISRPLAARNERLKVLPAPLETDVLRGELESAESIAVIKVGRHFDRVRTLLEETGHGPSALIVEHASGDKQTITPLRDFAADARPYFSIILSYRGAEAWAS